MPPRILSLPPPAFTVSSPLNVAIISDALVNVSLSLLSVSVETVALAKFDDVSVPKTSPLVLVADVFAVS